MLGEPVEYHYYSDEASGRDFWFEACADYHRKGWFVRQCTALARSYHATGKPEYARRAALILDRFAQAYPHMAVLKQGLHRPRQHCQTHAALPVRRRQMGAMDARRGARRTARGLRPDLRQPGAGQAVEGTGRRYPPADRERFLPRDDRVLPSLSARSRAAPISSTCRRSTPGRSSTSAGSSASRSTYTGVTAG